MKTISNPLLVFATLMSLASLCHSHQIDAQTQQRLIADDRKYSFDFDDFSVDTLKVLIEAERKIKVDIATQVDQQKTTDFKIKEINFLDYLQQGADQLNLEAIQLESNRIMLVPKP